MSQIRKYRFLFLLLTISLTTQSIAQPLAIGPEKIKSLDSLYRITFPSSDPGAIIIVAQGGRPVFKKAYGMANLENNVLLNTDHKMGIGSISKQFAAISILLLQQDGKLNIKDDIRKYLPAYNTYGKTITIENILSHTSGIPSYTEMYGFDTISNKTISNYQLVKFFEKQPLLFDPGTNWSYTNSGYVLAGLIVEKITGKPFNDFLQQRIFKPLLMTETSLGSSTFILPGKASEYSGPTPKGRMKVETQYNWYWAYAAGQIVSTVDDMLKWDEALYNPAFIRPDLLKTAHTSFILKNGEDAHYGTGWAISTFNNKTMVQHGGSIGGYRAQGMRIPEDHLYVLILSNSATTNASLTANKSLSILYEMPSLKETRENVQSWKEIEGMYASPNSGLRLQSNFGPKEAYYTIRVDSSNRVTAQRTSAAPISLSAAGKDLLFDKANPFAGWKIERNAQGIVEGIRFTQFFPGYGPERYNKKISAVIPPKPVPGKIDSIGLVKYTGTYEHEFGNRGMIIIEKGQLYMEDPVIGTKTALHWISGNTFWIKESDIEVIFYANAKGLISGVKYFNGFREMNMKRVEENF
jgi:CubicO group peptidase (beta-lactamase class C family)